VSESSPAPNLEWENMRKGFSYVECQSQTREMTTLLESAFRFARTPARQSSWRYKYENKASKINRKWTEN
jgi:hypothetical protein